MWVRVPPGARGGVRSFGGLTTMARPASLEVRMTVHLRWRWLLAAVLLAAALACLCMLRAVPLDPVRFLR